MNKVQIDFLFRIVARSIINQRRPQTKNAFLMNNKPAPQGAAHVHSIHDQKVIIRARHKVYLPLLRMRNAPTVQKVAPKDTD